MTVNKQNGHESVINYLSSLMWDGMPRLDRWLIDTPDLGRSPLVKK